VGIDHYLLRAGLEGGAAEIGRGGLQRVEEERGGAVVDLIGEEETQSLHEGDLDRVRVFEDGQFERVTRAAGVVGAELDASLLPALMEVTQLTVLERGRSALDSVDLDVLTTSDVGWKDEIRNTHEKLLPTPLPL